MVRCYVLPNLECYVFLRNWTQTQYWSQLPERVPSKKGIVNLILVSGCFQFSVLLPDIRNFLAKVKGNIKEFMKNECKTMPGAFDASCLIDQINRHSDRGLVDFNIEFAASTDLRLDQVDFFLLLQTTVADTGPCKRTNV